MEKITAQTGPLAFIGGGAMTEAIIKGILGAGLADPGEIFVGEPSAARCEYLQKTYGIKASGDNKAVVKDAGLIILAVKPQVVDAAITAELAAAMPPQATVLSIMGSVDLAKLHQVVPGHAVIRVMPNTPLAVGAGMTAIAPDSKVSSEMIDAAKTIFGSCGEVEVVAESAIEAITAVSGCGPGYVFMLIDALADAGVNAGAGDQAGRPDICRQRQNGAGNSIASSAAARSGNFARWNYHCRYPCSGKPRSACGDV